MKVFQGHSLFQVFVESKSCVCSPLALVLSTGIGPVLGLLFIPLIGSASDHCNSSYGRRRPFIWLLSSGVLLALVIIPHADVLAARLTRGGRTLQVRLFLEAHKAQGKEIYSNCNSLCCCITGGLSNLWGRTP